MRRKIYPIAVAMTAAFLSLSAPAAAALVPLYQLYSSTYKDYFYTIDPQQRAVAINTYGYADQGVVARVESSQVAGTAPFWRFYKGLPQTDHVYTTFSDEVDLVVPLGWVFEGTEGYVYTTQVPGTYPLYRYSHFDGATSDLAHFYTVDASRHAQLLAGGWGYDRIAGYVWLATDPQLGVQFNNGTLTITNPLSGTSNNYQVGRGTLLPTQADLNGRPGNEVAFTGPAGTQTKVLVIDDSARAVHTYLFENGIPNAFLLGPYDLDRVPGKELVYLINGLGGSALYVIADNTQTKFQFFGYQNGFLSLIGVDDFAGRGVNDIAVSNGATVFVSSFEQRFSYSYVIGNATNRIFPPADTNGVAGKEIVAYVTPVFSGAFMKVIDHAARFSRTYTIGAAAIFLPFRDRDGQPGAEICYQELASGLFKQVVDRNVFVQTVPNCS